MSAEYAPKGGTSVADLLGSEPLSSLHPPYPGRLVRPCPAPAVGQVVARRLARFRFAQAAWRMMSGHGRCIQGVNGA